MPTSNFALFIEALSPLLVLLDVQFLSLKSIHTLLVSNISPEAQVELCLQRITEDFNGELADFTLKYDDGNSWRP